MVPESIEVSHTSFEKKDEMKSRHGLEGLCRYLYILTCMRSRSDMKYVCKAKWRLGNLRGGGQYHVRPRERDCTGVCNKPSRGNLS